MTKIIKLKEINPEMIQLVHNHLREGEVIAYPTDTIYGLGVNVFSPQGLHKLAILKGREHNKPFSILYSSVERLLSDFSSVLNEYQKFFVSRLLPGKVTLVLPAPPEKKFPPEVVMDNHVGVRVVTHATLNKLFESYENPVTTTSVNPSGMPPARNKGEILGYFKNKVSLLIYDRPVRKVSVSTVIKVTKDSFHILREGAVSIFEIIKKLER